MKRKQGGGGGGQPFPKKKNYRALVYTCNMKHIGLLYKTKKTTKLGRPK